MFSNQKVFSAYLCEKISSRFKHIQSNSLIIADIGSGSGLLTHFLANNFFNSTVIGIETNEKKREQASRKFSNCTFILKEDTYSFIQEQSCDLVIISLTLHHIEIAKRKSFINYAQALLKPNGYLVIIEFNPHTLFSKKEFCKELIKPKTIDRMLSNMEKKQEFFSYLPFGQLYAIIAKKLRD